ncbi:hypothetical protein L596_021501 [Steinernema carpocapsae]|uniref:Uncharacterized protein n=1 Tax=Steinernema carpocapsae TaxID=34508 RepID=A0A4V5ZZX7_STECR|nr:hypothetical protein L596_021501 [Steinernema carpocapsae]
MLKKDNGHCLKDEQGVSMFPYPGSAPKMEQPMTTARTVVEAAENCDCETGKLLIEKHTKKFILLGF